MVSPSPLDEQTPVDERCRPLVDGFLRALDAALPDLVDRVYVTGSALTDDWSPRSDVDTVIVVTRPVTDDDAPTLCALHAATIGEHCVDGLYLTEPELFAGPDRVLSAPHVINGRFTPTERRGQLAWVTWLELSTSPVARISAGRVTWTGPEPPPIADLPARAAAYSRGNLLSYWAPLGDSAEETLGKLPAAAVVPADGIVWVVLGPGRLLHTIETGRVISKTAGGLLVAERWPEFAALVQKAIRARRGADETFTVEEGYAAVELLHRCIRAGGPGLAEG